MKAIRILGSAVLVFSLAIWASTSAMAGPEVSFAAVGASSDLAAYPPARPGEQRHVIRLPAQGDETRLKVELIVGKTMKIDCNSYAFGGRLEERTAKGWGYAYYVLESLGQSASTMKGCLDGARRDAFVRSSQEMLVRYNSRLPLVVYTPADVELRYRIWRADAERR